MVLILKILLIAACVFFGLILLMTLGLVLMFLIDARFPGTSGMSCLLTGDKCPHADDGVDCMKCRYAEEKLRK